MSKTCEKCIHYEVCRYPLEYRAFPDTCWKYEEERPHGEWVSCSERLPEEDGKYLVCWCGAWGVDICFAEYSKCGKYWHEKYGGEYRGITAWMPLPEPYKEGDSDAQH